MFLDFLPPLHTTATALHLAALVPALCCAAAADLLALSTVRRPLSPVNWARLMRLHRTILFALALLWVSGLCLIGLKLMPGGGGLTPKLFTKGLVVGLLTLNAFAISGIALPHLRALTTRPFGALPLPTRMTLGTIAGLSAAAWAAALYLGAAPWLKPLGFAALAQALSPIFAVGLGGGLLLGLAAAHLQRSEPSPDLAAHSIAR